MPERVIKRYKETWSAENMINKQLRIVKIKWAMDLKSDSLFSCGRREFYDWRKNGSDK